eukprot:SAG31_NODE_71_length_28115_cov_4.128105_15_plen_136_part_00
MLDCQVEAVAHRVRADFPGARLVERHSRRLRFELDSGVPHEILTGNSGLPAVGDLFGRMESARLELRSSTLLGDEQYLAEYAASQTTLEQIFNDFAGQAGPDASVAEVKERCDNNESDHADASNPLHGAPLGIEL